MFRAYGLYGHIQANRVRSVLLEVVQSPLFTQK